MSVTFSNVRTTRDVMSPRTNGQLQGSLRVQALTNDDQAEVLTFLSRRPIHTVCMAGYILDHGVVSPLNRGTFYGCRTEDGKLQGVALIGHATLLETHSNEALKAFASLRSEYKRSHLIRGEHSMIERFWSEYAELGNERRLACRELLLEQENIPMIDGPVPDLRPATTNDLETVMNINADLLQAECGINPIDRDLDGFRSRLLTRIRQGRIWTWSRDDLLLFKADIFAETPAMTYLEGVYVNPKGRGQGNGLRCMAQLSRLLLNRTSSICLLINDRKKRLEHFYNKAGYQARAWYDTIYLHRDAS